MQSDIEEVKARMAGEEPFLAFVGPLKDQEGKVQIAAGTTPDIETLESMDWLAEGVVGSIPD